jgi:hypothetical protein
MSPPTKTEQLVLVLDVVIQRHRGHIEAGCYGAHGHLLDSDLVDHVALWVGPSDDAAEGKAAFLEATATKVHRSLKDAIIRCTVKSKGEDPPMAIIENSVGNSRTCSLRPALLRIRGLLH